MKNKFIARTAREAKKEAKELDQAGNRIKVTYLTVLRNGKVETWYDRSIRSWVTKRSDKQGNQIDKECDYNGQRSGAEASHRIAVISFG